MEIRDKYLQKTNQTTDDNFETLNIKEKEIYKIPLFKDVKNRPESRITTINKSRRSKQTDGLSISGNHINMKGNEAVGLGLGKFK